MRLGNSGANNKGKKYIKINQDSIATPENQTKADNFATWFGVWYSRIQTELIRKDTYDEDILNDTFMRIFDKIRFGGLEISDYKAYFHRAFFTNFMQKVFIDTQGTMISIDSHDEIDNTESDEELIRFKSVLEQDIFHYVYQRYPVQEFELFKMYVRLKPAVNYSELSKLTNITVSDISATISKIRRDIRRQRDFRNRRQYTLRCSEY
ncbi:hypothetical protein [Dysgonomonas macrotermitis]|uniref:RNA polymerase sigma factor, sigma-70 family n=1 Tax=Dysgonomonas macrotermitis TaxID=1346286 RepID=A0A1M5F6E6_9BACT|nr:hypothetical protein [Dysgonomonas macrotermitis]SHF87057.1 hypothetical protein SAMN05444362_11166 [Dysgonomonas macrotermitis]